MKKNIFFLFLNLILNLNLLLNLSSCNTTEPTDDIKPGRRDYVWTVDTLDALNNPYYRMWASSPTDVWCISSANWDKSIAHFDGIKWSLYGVSGLINPFSIYGFSNNNIFIGAENGKIWRYDGSTWNLFAALTKDGHDYIVFDNMWGESANNFYASGGYPDSNSSANNSVIAHFVNSTWIMLNTEEIIGIVERVYKNNNDKIYLRTNRIGNINTLDSTLIYEYSQGNYKQLYSSVWTQGLQADISLINGEVYFVLGNEIAVRRNNKFQTIINVDNSNFYQRIWGRNSKDIFLLMTDGLAHYNGNNIEYVFYFNLTPRTQIYGAALFKDEAFFLAYEAQTGLSLVYHGTLKNE